MMIRGRYKLVGPRADTFRREMVAQYVKNNPNEVKITYLMEMTS